MAPVVLIFVVLGLCLALGIPVAFAIGMSALTFLLAAGDVSPMVMVQRMVDGARSYTMMALPMFIYAGSLMAFGSTPRLMRLANMLVSRVPGGLGAATLVTCGFFGAVSRRDVVLDVFFGTDYHSHLGTRNAGMAVWNTETGCQRQIHSIKNTPFRTKFEDDLAGFSVGVVDREKIIGVRTPALRKLAKELRKDPDIGEFLQDLPHTFFDENQLHAFIISEIKDYDKCICEIEQFLPYVDNWATSDSISPKVFKKHRGELLPRVYAWIGSGRTYSVRYGVFTLMNHFLEEDFSPEYPELVIRIESDEYYINMMIAWYFATALAKQYDAAIPYIEKGILDRWTHNKTIQKAVESRRVTAERKEYLKTLRKK